MTKQELEVIVRRVWPATYLVRATQTPDAWELELKSRGVVTYHRVDFNGHPTCHDTCADREANLERNDLSDTSYASVLRTTRRGDHRVERVLIKSSGQEAIRVSWWPEGQMSDLPMEVPEEEFIALLAQGVIQGVFSSRFVFKLIEAIKTAGNLRAVQSSEQSDDAEFRTSVPLRQVRKRS